jgi:hypothetical protein
MKLFSSILFVCFCVLLIPQSSFSNILSSRDLVDSFDCTMMGPTGMTQIVFNQNDKYEVLTRRNYFNSKSYVLDNAGRSYASENEKTQMVLSGGGLLSARAYLVLMFDGYLKSGVTESITGAVIYATSGGSVFSPTTQASSQIGTVRCKFIRVK